MSTSSAERNPVELLAEEFADRLRRGETPSLSEYVGKYPQHADQIRKVFPALVLMEQLKPIAGDLTGDFVGARSEESQPLKRLGDYRIVREVGRGGMGVVYEAEQISLGRHVALKVLPSAAMLRPTYLERFRREAKAAARLHHTNIVPVFGVGESDGVLFYAMQFIGGEGLDKVLVDVRRLRHQPVKTRAEEASVAQSLLSGYFLAATTVAADAPVVPPDPQAALVKSHSTSGLSGTSPEAEYCRGVARIGVQVADALGYAHRQGILHRDIKPSNLMIDRQGIVWVTDFGLAKAEGTDDLTHTGDIVGTIRFMAPERFEGQSLPQSDIYALGLTLYELLTLRPAFADTNKARLIERILSEPPVPPRKLDARIPRDLETVVMKCLHTDPSQRYATAEMLAEDLRRFLADRPIKARRISRTEQVWKWCRRNPAVAGLTAAVLLLLVTVAFVSSVSTLWLKEALSESKRATAAANTNLWRSYLDQARASRMTRQPGQRFQSLRAIENALRLPVPVDRSLDELRTEAIAALCVPDIEIAKELKGEGYQSFVVDPAFERYAWADKDGNVFVHRVEGNAELLHLPGTGTVPAYDGLKFSPDGRFLHQICEGKQGTRSCVVWRLDGPQPVAALKDEHAGIAFRSDSQQCAASYPDGSIRVYDLASNQEVTRFRSGLNEWGHLAWNPRYDLLGIFKGSVLRVINVKTGKVMLEKQRQNLAWIDWHPDGNLLAVCNNGPATPQICLWDIRTDQLTCPPLEGHKHSGLIVRFNQAGDRLVSNDWSYMLRLWDARTGRQLLAHPSGGTCLEFRGDDGILAADVSTHTARLFRCRTGQEFRTLPDHYLPKANTRVGQGDGIVHSEGRLVAVSSDSGILLADLERGEEVALLPLAGGNTPLRFDPADDSLWTYGTNGVLRWPIRADPAKPQAKRVGPPEQLSEVKTKDKWGNSRDGNVVAIPNYSRGALLWQRDLGRLMPLGPQHDVRYCSVSPDGHWVATGTHHRNGNEARAKVWDAQTGHLVAALSVETPCQVGFSPDGKWLMTSSEKFRLWEVGTWVEKRTFGEFTIPPGFAFSADGKLLAVGDLAQGVVRLEETATGRNWPV